MFQKIFYLVYIFILFISNVQNNNIFINDIYGTLIEYEKNQLLTIVFSDILEINELTKFELVKGLQTYTLSSDCYNDLNSNNFTMKIIFSFNFI